MRFKVCSEDGCPTLVEAGTTRCPQCARRKERRRGSSTARGYGAAHRKLRARWVARIAKGGVSCWRCGVLLEAGEPFDLGHDDEDRAAYRGPECVPCNRATSGR